MGWRRARTLVLICVAAKASALISKVHTNRCFRATSSALTVTRTGGHLTKSFVPVEDVGRVFQPDEHTKRGAHSVCYDDTVANLSDRTIQGGTIRVLIVGINEGVAKAKAVDGGVPKSFVKDS